MKGGYVIVRQRDEDCRWNGRTMDAVALFHQDVE